MNIRHCFPQTATGLALDFLAQHVFGVTRISRRPCWWPFRWWPRVWPFVESDREVRARVMAKVMGYSVCTVAPGESVAAGDLVGTRADGTIEPMKARHR